MILLMVSDLRILVYYFTKVVECIIAALTLNCEACLFIYGIALIEPFIDPFSDITFPFQVDFKSTSDRLSLEKLRVYSFLRAGLALAVALFIRLSSCNFI